MVGSDLAVMEVLGTYGRPLFGRVQEMTVGPLSVAQVAELTGLSPAGAFDAYLVTGGFPLIVSGWRRRGMTTPAQFVADQLQEPTSPLVVVGERILIGEFPPATQASPVLRAIGSGESGFTRIGQASGIAKTSLERALTTLVAKRVVAVDAPMLQRANLHRYRVADAYLRFWLRFIGPNLDLILRGRGDVVARQVADSWQDYSGKAVEPLVRSSLERMLPDARFGPALFVGGYWTRTNDPEIDLVGAAVERPTTTTRRPHPIEFIGSIKWRRTGRFGRGDHAALVGQQARVPGAELARLVGVSRNGFEPGGLLNVELGPADLLDAWR